MDTHKTCAKCGLTLSREEEKRVKFIRIPVCFGCLTGPQGDSLRSYLNVHGLVNKRGAVTCCDICTTRKAKQWWYTFCNENEGDWLSDFCG